MRSQSPDNTVAILSIVVSGSVIVLAALIAAVAAHYREKGSAQRDAERLDKQLEAERVRQEQALDHERVRQEQALDHELQRLKQQFNHERVLNDMQEKRKVLDDTIDAIDTAFDRISDLRLAESEEERRAASEQLAEEIERSNVALSRLLVRFGEDHYIVTAYRPLFWTVRDRWRAERAISDAADGAAREKHLQTFNTLTKRYPAQFTEFLRAAHKEGGVIEAGRPGPGS